MKRKNNNDFISTKKKAKHLTERQTEIAHFIVEKLEENKIEWAISLLENIFFENKKMEALLTCTEYKPFTWAIENQDFKLIKYFIEHNTPRGNFLALCRNNYENIYKFINRKNSKENSDRNGEDFEKVINLFIKVKPEQIIPVLKKIVDEEPEFMESDYTPRNNLKIVKFDENIEKPYEIKSSNLIGEIAEE